MHIFNPFLPPLPPSFPKVFFAYAVVTPTKSILFVNKKQLEDSTVKALADDAAKVEIRPYEAFWDYLKGDLKQELGLIGDASNDAVSIFYRK